MRRERYLLSVCSLASAMPNKGVQATAYSVRFASASCSA